MHSLIVFLVQFLSTQGVPVQVCGDSVVVAASCPTSIVYAGGSATGSAVGTSQRAKPPPPPENHIEIVPRNISNGF